MTYEDENPNQKPAPDSKDWSISPREIARIEAEAAAILRGIDERNRLENPPPESNMARALVEDLRRALDYDPGAPDEAVLRRQADALDTAFRRLLGDADTLYANSERCEFEPMKYAAAFKAQDQYRRTLQAIKSLRSKKKRKIRPART